MSTPLRKKIKVKQLLLLLFVGFIFVFLSGALIKTTTLTKSVGDALLERNLETATANAVTSVVVSYRGFDTLGEVTVLFLAASGIGFMFAKREKSEVEPEIKSAEKPSEMMRVGTTLLFPVLLLFGIYIIAHGHLSPGGGFQGGVIIATAIFLRLIASENFSLSHGKLSILETLSGSFFVVFGLIGLALGLTFLGNFLPHAQSDIGMVVSGGVIPLIYVLVGIKVGSEISAIFEQMLESSKEHA